MTGCSYCGRNGHGIATCSQRQEDRFGTPEDRTETGEELLEGSDDE